MNRLLPFSFALSAALLVGCATPSPSNLQERSANTSPDVRSAQEVMLSKGFKYEDFGSKEAMRSAATMVAHLGSEWQHFDRWSHEILERKADYLAEIHERDEQVRNVYFRGGTYPDGRHSNGALGRYSSFTDREAEFIRAHMEPTSCFNEDGSVRHYSDYADAETRRILGHADNPALALVEWRKAERLLGEDLSWDEFLDHQVEEALARHGGVYEDPEQYLLRAPERQKALYRHGSYCTVNTPTKHVHYVLNVHFQDVKGSLVAAVVDRVGWSAAIEMAEQVLAAQIENPNVITDSLWQNSHTGGDWATPVEPLPAFIGRAKGVAPQHSGGMCSPVGRPKQKAYVNIVDETADPMATTWQCLPWTETNWADVARQIVRESKPLKKYMEEYSSVTNGYSVPQWAYPGAGYSPSQTTLRMRDIKRDGGISATTVMDRETCTTYAAEYSNLATWTYPACEALSALAEAFEDRSEAIGTVVQARPVLTREELSAGMHK